MLVNEASFARHPFRAADATDWRLAHALPLSTSNGPLSSSPRSFPGFEQSDSNRSPKAKDMHHGRFGGQPLDGGFSDLFGAHLGSSGPTPNGAPGTATSRTVMAGLRPEAAGEYSWSPDGKWLAFSATDETEFSTINVWRVDTRRGAEANTPLVQRRGTKVFTRRVLPVLLLGSAD